LERPLSHRFWALASYTRSDGSMTDRIWGGISYKAVYLKRQATMVSVLYDGYSFVDELSPASLSWNHAIEARLSQDIGFLAGGRDHCFQLTGYIRAERTGNTQVLVGLRYML
jgi:hypothetical protein